MLGHLLERYFNQWKFFAKITNPSWLLIQVNAKSAFRLDKRSTNRRVGNGSKQMEGKIGKSVGSLSLLKVSEVLWHNDESCESP